GSGRAVVREEIGGAGAAESSSSRAVEGIVRAGIGREETSVMGNGEQPLPPGGVQGGTEPDVEMGEAG
ncbi:MAG: hypothetical protein Q9173_002315, partial [Seirophora scorigena]